MLPHDDTGTDLPTEVTTSLCHILINLSQSDRQHVRAIVDEGALPKVISISSVDNGLVQTGCAKMKDSLTPNMLCSLYQYHL